MLRHLARVVAIDDITPIEGADRIECAHVGGWAVVVGKGQYAPGDHAVYFEIDSVLDVDDPRFAFLAERGVKSFLMLEDQERELVRHVIGHVLKTVRLRGQVSQGLLMTLSELGLSEDTTVGTDVTEILGVVKYDPYTPGSPRIGPYPTWLCPVTDSERVQNLANHFEELRSYTWYPTVKVDGASSTIWRDADGIPHVASRRMEVRMEGEPRAFPEVLAACEPDMAVQFEICGPKFQSNRLHLKGNRPFVFAVFRKGEGTPHEIPRDQWPKALLDLAVPILDIPFPETVEDAIAQADGLRGNVTKDALDEGIVWHTTDGACPPCLGSHSTFKVINNRYLLKG